MSQVKVWNDNIYEYKENFRGDIITIPPKECVLMDADQAQAFYGSFNGILRDADGGHDPKGFKMLRIEYPVGQRFRADMQEPDPLRCIVCNYKADSKENLEQHMKTSHAGQRLVDEDAEKVAAARAEQDELKAQLEALKAENEALKKQTTSATKRSRGRPRRTDTEPNAE